MNRRHVGFVVLAAAACLLAAGLADAGQWAEWRGPARRGTSAEKDLISSWSQDGENLLWKVPFTGRSTPVVFDGRVCATGRAGEGIRRQEMVACFDAESGEQLWEKRWNVYHTSVPWTRVGWAGPAGDPETGFLYVQGVGGLFFCFDSRSGEIVWSRRLVEELGFMEGYGGRTQTPTIDDERLIVTFSNTSWGEETRPLHRLRAFDKRTGELLWVSAPAPSQADKNTQSTPSAALINGRRLIIAGNGSGGIYAVEAETGEPVWGFQLSKRGINTSVVVHGTTVYASHSEENVDEGTMGRVVAIDATGEGDVTGTHEIWRAPISAGYSSATLSDGRLYVVDNSANLHALDAKSGAERWTLNVGRVGKGSPVAADGKLYLTEVNGRFVIVEPRRASGQTLDLEEISMPGEERLAEIYGSPAIAGRRIYFTTEEGLYCLGRAERPPAETVASAPGRLEEMALEGAAPARLRVMPAEEWSGPGESIAFRVRAFDAKGRDLGPREAVWSLDGLAGEIDGSGTFTPAGQPASQAGRVVARLGELSAAGRVRVLQDLPLAEDFEGIEAGSKPAYQMGYLMAFKVEDQDGSKVLAKNPAQRKIHRHVTFLGRPDLSDYTIQTDLKGTRAGRKVPDMGLINSGYTLEILGGHQKLQVRSWQAGLRMMQQQDFAWTPDVWYAMKLRVAEENGKGIIRGKVWPRDEAEPEDWSITVEDPLPIRSGSPGLSGYSPTPIYFDNVKVTRNR